MKSYFLYRGGKKYGPYTDVQLKRAASIGKLKHDDLLSDDEGTVKQVSSMAEFAEWFGSGLPAFKATPAEKPAPVNPFPESMTRHKACNCGKCHLKQQPAQAEEIDTGKLIEGIFGILAAIASLAMAAWWAALAFSL